MFDNGDQSLMVITGMIDDSMDVDHRCEYMLLPDRVVAPSKGRYQN